MVLTNPASLAPALIYNAPGGTISTGVYIASDRAMFTRFCLATGGTYRYINWVCGVQSGNIQVGVVQLSGTGRLTYTLIKGSGVISCPAAAAIRTDLGAFYLQAGDYAMFFWADNTTVTVSKFTAIPSTHKMAGQVLSLPTTGVVGTGTLAWNATASVNMSLEADV